MTESDSPILDFYPLDFEIDMNGKKMVWQAVALLPFIDEARLLGAMGTKYPGLTEEEQRREATRTAYNIRVGLLYGKDTARGASILGLVGRLEAVRRDVVAARVGALHTQG